MSRSQLTPPSAKLLSEGITLQQQGRTREAESRFLKVLRQDPKNVAALYSLAAICENNGKLPDALKFISRATQINPRFAQGLLAKSIILQKLGLISQASSAANDAMAIEPSLSGLAAQRDYLNSLMQAGGLASQAENPVDGGSLSESQLRRVQEALQLQSKGDLIEAEAAFSALLEESAHCYEALYSLGVIANQRGDPGTALSYLERARSVQPTNPMAHFSAGTVQQTLGLFEDAIASFDMALSIEPKYKDAMVNKCSVLHSMNRQAEAVEVMRSALDLFPDDPALLMNLGYLLTEFKQNAAAATFFKRLVEVSPYHDYAQGLHAYARLHACDWSDFDSIRANIISGVEASQRVCNPLALLALTDDASINQRCAIDFGRAKYPAAASSLWNGERFTHRKTRLALISADFREHPVGYLLIELIERLPDFGFETYGISLGINDGSLLHKRYKQAFSHYLSCQGKTSLEVASALRTLEIDIAIDLCGYTSGTRLDILAHRPCPAQATYLGFPGTLGLPFIDYMIADYFIVPEEQESFYSERVLKLPHSYLPRDSSVRPSTKTPSRSEFGLPAQGPVFCSFNHAYKINPPMFEVWMKLLVAHPGSVLWLMRLNDDARSNLKREASQRGVDPERLVFAERLPSIEDHLARYRLVDVFLDTFPYGGHTTASDALLVGTPVVSMSGRSFASRVAGGMLNDLGQVGRIANSFGDYFAIASELVSAPPERLEGLHTDSESMIEHFVQCVEQMS